LAEFGSGFGDPGDMRGRSRGVGRPGRWLRGLAGVDEDLLRWAWPERSRHTALGGVILGTAAIAGFSMWNFITEILGVTSVWALVPTLLWFLFILNLDRWIVSSQAGTSRRLGPFLVRLVVAMLFGVIIAEPLVLRVFQTAIEQQISDERDQQVRELRSQLVACNPDPANADAMRNRPQNCADYILSFNTSPENDAAQLAALRQDAIALEKTVKADTRQLTALNNNVRSECRRLYWNRRFRALVRSSECHRLRAVVRDYVETHNTDANKDRLDQLNTRISQLEDALSSAHEDFLKHRDEAIAKEIDKLRANQQAIGFLERMQALERFAVGNAALFFGAWLLRIFFIVIDCLPVLVKFLGGTSAYDKILATASAGLLRGHAEAVRKEERELTSGFEIAQAEYEQQVRKRKAEIDADMREHTARMNIRCSQAIRSLEEELRERSPT
jgi:hypothetical protein